MSQPKYRKSLNKRQLDILIALYKFRYLTRDLLVEYLEGSESTGSYEYSRLQRLVEQGYIDRHYSNLDKIDRRPAAYFALPGAIRALKDRTKLDINALNAMYADKRAGRTFIDRCLLVFTIFNRFKSAYGNQRLDFFTKREMSQYDFFPKPLPDAFISIKNKAQEEDSRYFLELFDGTTQNKKQWQRIKSYMEHYDSGDWEDDTGWDYPDLLFICETPQVEKRIARHAEKLQAYSGADMNVFTASYKALQQAKSAKDKIWTNVDEPEELLSMVE